MKKLFSPHAWLYLLTVATSFTLTAMEPVRAQFVNPIHPDDKKTYRAAEQIVKCIQDETVDEQTKIKRLEELSVKCPDLNFQIGPSRVNPLCLACQQGSTSIVDFLCLHGANPNLFAPEQKSDGYKPYTLPFIVAAQANATAIVQTLLAHGAHVNIICPDGTGLFMYLLHKGLLNAAAPALINGCNPNYASTLEGGWALCKALELGKLLAGGTCPKLLKDFSPDPHAQEDGIKGVTLKKKLTLIAGKLMNPGMKQLRYGLIETTPQVQPNPAPANTVNAIITEALQAGANMSTDCGDGCTPFMMAVIDNQLTVVHHAIELTQDKAALAHAITNPCLTVKIDDLWAKMPLAARFMQIANKTITLSVLHTICKNEYAPVWEKILPLLNPEQIDIRDSDGRTPLIWALYNESEKIVHLLLRYHANTNALTSYGTRPLHVACAFGNASTVKVMLDAGADPLLEDPVQHIRPIHVACLTPPERQEKIELLVSRCPACVHTSHDQNSPHSLLAWVLHDLLASDVFKYLLDRRSILNFSDDEIAMAFLHANLAQSPHDPCTLSRKLLESGHTPLFQSVRAHRHKGKSIEELMSRYTVLGKFITASLNTTKSSLPENCYLQEGTPLQALIFGAIFDTRYVELLRTIFANRINWQDVPCTISVNDNLLTCTTASMLAALYTHSPLQKELADHQYSYADQRASPQGATVKKACKFHLLATDYGYTCLLYTSEAETVFAK